MSATFDPDNSARPHEPWSVVFLSNRDVSGQVPINFVTRPGISVTAGCFGDRIYDPILAQRCISNLLSAEFRRLVFDVYWDPGSRQYNLCPVAFPVAAGNYTYTSLTSAGASSSTISQTLPSMSGSAMIASGSSTINATMKFPGLNSSSTSPSTTSSAPVTTITSSTSQTLLQLGPYQCSTSLNLQWVTSMLQDFFEMTSDAIQAKVLFVELNLHAVAATDRPDEPAAVPRGSELPQDDELVSGQFSTVLGEYIFGPAELQSERSDLNNSWFNTPKSRYPITEFFNMQASSNGDLSTQDGWPTENYLLISKGTRLLLNWGRIDPQMQSYGFAGDNNTIFSSRDVIETRKIDANGAGDLLSGCFYEEGDTNVARVNSSWATVTQTQLFPALINNITACGVSPVLNNTLHNAMANVDMTPYNTFVQAAVWNWAVGEPRNYSAPGVDMDDPQSQFRCAFLDTTSAYHGRWRVEDCQGKYPAACRVNNQPYEWLISSARVTYGTASQVCPTNTTFDVPRTSLENTYLVHKILSNSPPSGSSDGGISGVWINFNSLDVLQCWVDSGPDGTCPYYEDPKAQQQRSILVPTIGALIILTLTALTIFIKCGANRKNSRIRRRGLGLGAWEYEGVPS